jgi:hypothetical protein
MGIKMAIQPVMPLGPGAPPLQPQAHEPEEDGEGTDVVSKPEESSTKISGCHEATETREI